MDKLHPEFQQKVDAVIKLLKERGVSDAIIAECFIPEETENDIEVAGSIIMALEMQFDKPWADHISVCESIVYPIFNELAIEDVSIKDYTKKKFEEGEETISSCEEANNVSQ